jgi:rhamnopyranosyl-N-acetylglucosaminyl-diphospho-decaprenol beta-1,3/1,4-galactofuranosyltransferase
MGLKCKIAVVVVTYNRLELLRNCLSAISVQSLVPDRLIVIDNGSSDGTVDELPSLLEATALSHEVVFSSENLGGAGGFRLGLELATKAGFDRVWMMDDDAVPDESALEKLVIQAIDPMTLYGSVAYCGDKTSWLTGVYEGDSIKLVSELAKIKPRQEVDFIPFLGIFVSAEIVSRIGLPESSFFIAADDVEYSMRAKSMGVKVVMCGESLISHPRNQVYKVSLVVKDVWCPRLVPWKRYYDTRNRLVIAKKYYGARVYWQTIPASFLRLFAALVNEPDKTRQLRAFFAGLFDGLTGRMGARHLYWGF